MKDEEVKNWLENQQWIYAKTWADTYPHEYIVKDYLGTPERKQFPSIVEHIQENGNPSLFLRKEYTYFYAGAYKYWTVGNEKTKTKIINREKITKEEKN